MDVLPLKDRIRNDHKQEDNGMTPTKENMTQLVNALENIQTKLLETLEEGQ